MKTYLSWYRGVCWHPSIGQWEAQVFNGVRQISLGYCESEAQAVIASKAATTQIRAPLACTKMGYNSESGERTIHLASERKELAGCF